MSLNLSSIPREELELKARAKLELNRRKSERKTVYGFVDPKDGHIKSLKRNGTKWERTRDDPDVYMCAKMELVLRSTKRFIVIIGGRGSSKSMAVADLCIADAKDTGAKTYFLREYQSSIKNSVYNLIKDEIKQLEFHGFNVLKQNIEFKGDSVFEFAGLARNVDSVKSTHGFKRFAVEEAQFISQDSLDALTPTLRKSGDKGLPVKFQEPGILQDISTHPELDNVSIIFIANPGSSADPFSQRFIEPFRAKMDENGVYEDDMHMIVRINHDDNPWFEESGLDEERLWDHENRSRAYYYHRWEGAYNDEVEDSIIQAEWFDAAVDAHKLEHLKKAFEPRGAKVAAHDPSGTGTDEKGYAERHGSIIQKVSAKSTGDIDDGCDWATGQANQSSVDWFVWDGDGMGAGLKRQVSTAFEGKRVKYHMFRGSLSGKGQDNANRVFMPEEGDQDTKAKTYAETFKNNRSQYYARLATRFYNVYRCVERGDYVDPEDMISIESSGVDDLPQLRAELCRVPTKPNPFGLIQIMSKDEMAKLGIKSPNRGDSVMMCTWQPAGRNKLPPLEYPKRRIV